jgi:flavodoxin
MKALVVYASWFGHNRSIAKLIAEELSRRGWIVSCVPATRVTPSDVAGYNVLVLGTYTHAGQASHRLRALCESIPRRQFDWLTVALFGTQIAQDKQPSSGGVDELEACLLGRGCELALAPLRIELPAAAAFRSASELGDADQRRVGEFAADLWEAGVPAPMV